MPGGPLIDVTRETFDLTFAVNARAPMATMQVDRSAHGRARRRGHREHRVSANAFKNESPEAPYNASKAALVALTNAAAHEWGHLNIRANCVAPGQTITPERGARDRADPDDARLQHDYLRRIPLRGPGCHATRRWRCCSSPPTMPR